MAKDEEKDVRGEEFDNEAQAREREYVDKEGNVHHRAEKEVGAEDEEMDQ